MAKADVARFVTLITANAEALNAARFRLAVDHEELDALTNLSSCSGRWSKATFPRTTASTGSTREA
jgi:hypothetical protein